MSVRPDLVRTEEEENLPGAYSIENQYLCQFFGKGERKKDPQRCGFPKGYPTFLPDVVVFNGEIYHTSRQSSY